jgi:hypothetical protein
LDNEDGVADLAKEKSADFPAKIDESAPAGVGHKHK